MRTAAAQAMLEFALAVSVFMLLLLGTFDMARAYLSYTVLANSAREASRYAAAHYGETGWQAASVQAGRNLAVGVDTAQLVLNVTVSGTSSGYVAVDGTYTFHVLTPFAGALLGDPITMQVHTSALAG